MTSYALGLAILAAAGVSPASPGKHYNDPMAAYAAGDYDEALRLFAEAEVERPKDARIAYDIGNTNYRKGDFEAAAQAYGRAAAAATASGNPTLRAHADYNLGNALFRAQRLQEAIGAYEASKKLAPRDGDIDYNLELARRALREQQQQKQQPQQQGQQQKPDGQKPDQQQQPSGARPPDQGAKSNQQDASPPSAGEQQPQPQQQQQPGSPEAKPDAPAPRDQNQASAAANQDAAAKGANPSSPVPTGAQRDGATTGDATKAGAGQPPALNREAAERYLQQLGDTRPRLPKNQRGSRSSPVEKDW